MSRFISQFSAEVIYHRISMVFVLGCGATVPLLGSSLETANTGPRVLAQVSLWALWGILLLCVALPSSMSLTAVRLVAPAHSAIVGIVALADPNPASIIALIISITTTVIVFMAEVGTFFVQRSAYGDELRFPLRPPTPMIVVQTLTWLLWVGSAVVGSLALVNEAWVAGGILVAISVLGLVWLPPRFHRLSRRWLVRVPAGLVIHDHVLLAETAMFSRSAVVATDIVSDIEDAADLSGGGRSAAVRITLTDFDTVVLAATADQPGGRAIHVRSLVVRPSRPGRAIRALQN